MDTGPVARKKTSNIGPKSPETNLIVEAQRVDLAHEVVVQRPLDRKYPA